MSDSAKPVPSAAALKVRVAIVFPMYVPYHIARLQASCDRAPEGRGAVGVELVGGSDGRFPSVWRATGGVPPALALRTLFPGRDLHSISPRALRVALFKTLDDIAPSVVALPAWREIWTLDGLEWCYRNSVPTFTMSATTRGDKPRYWWKEQVKRHIVRQFVAGMAGGTPQKEYLTNLGLFRESVFLGYDVIDNDHFAEALCHGRAAGEKGNPIFGGNYFLCVCRLAKEKNLSRLLTAYQQYKLRAGAKPWHLVIVGEGRERKRLESRVGRLGLTGFVHLPGFSSYSELPKIYRAAGAFVLDSVYEPWGLVVNEAMASGLPVIISSKCGCGADLVKDKATGLIVDPMDPASLTAAMTTISSDPALREAMGERSRSVIANWSPAVFADRLWQIVDYALARPAGSQSKVIFKLYASWAAFRHRALMPYE
jgi:glycosyltransferase involved in cell wall biosynthesis